jgi:hypothetical protein
VAASRNTTPQPSSSRPCRTSYSAPDFPAPDSPVSRSDLSSAVSRWTPISGRATWMSPLPTRIRDKEEASLSPCSVYSRSRVTSLRYSLSDWSSMPASRRTRISADRSAPVLVPPYSARPQAPHYPVDFLTAS